MRGSRSAGGGDGKTAAGVCVSGVFAAAPLCPWDLGGLDVFGTLLPCPGAPCGVRGVQDPPGCFSLSPSLPEGRLLHLVSALKRQRACAIQTPARLCLQTASCLLFGSWLKVEVRFSTLGAPSSARFWEKPRGRFWQLERLCALARAGDNRRSPGGMAPGGTRGAFGRHGEGKAAKPSPGCGAAGTGLCHRGLCASACVPCGSHRPPRCHTWLPGLVAAPEAVTGHRPGRTRLVGWIWVGGRQRKVSGSRWGLLKRQRSFTYPHRAGYNHHQHLTR